MFTATVNHYLKLHRVVASKLCVVTFLLAISAAAHSAETPDYSEPKVIRSQNGVLRATLTVSEKTIEVGGVNFNAFIYNQDYAAPILEAGPGDHVIITIINHSSEPTNFNIPDIRAISLDRDPKHPEKISSGDAHTYDFIIPTYQPPGLYIYRANVIGHMNNQVSHGLAGSLLITGVDKAVPELSGHTVRILQIKEYLFEDSPDPLVKNIYHKVIETMNGLPLQDIPMRPHESQIWYLTNESSTSRVRLSAPQLRIIKLMDDVYFSDHPTPLEEIMLNPGNRLTLLVTAPEAGEYAVTALGIPTGSGSEKKLDRVLAKVSVAGIQATPLSQKIRLPKLKDLRLELIKQKREIIYSEQPLKDKYYIDNNLYNSDRIDQHVKFGSTEEWVVRNQSHDTHLFHIDHVYFQVIAFNDQPLKEISYHDTIRVPEEGSVTVRIPFTDPSLKDIVHYQCTMLEHADKGMMGTIAIEPLSQ